MQSTFDRTTILEEEFLLNLEVIAENYLRLTQEEEAIIKEIAKRF